MKKSKLIVLTSVFAVLAMVFVGCDNTNSGDDDPVFPMGQVLSQAYGQYEISVTITRNGENVTAVDVAKTGTAEIGRETGGRHEWLMNPTFSNNNNGNNSGPHAVFDESVIEHGNVVNFITDATAGATRSKWGLVAAGQLELTKAGDTSWPRVFQGTMVGTIPEGTWADTAPAYRGVFVNILVDREGNILNAWASHRTTSANADTGVLSVGSGMSGLGNFVNYGVQAEPARGDRQHEMAGTNGLVALAIEHNSFTHSSIRQRWDTFTWEPGNNNLATLLTDGNFDAFVGAGRAAVQAARSAGANINP